jgi:hypothetical protein
MGNYLFRQDSSFSQGGLITPKGTDRKLQVTVSRPIEQGSADFLAL